MKIQHEAEGELSETHDINVTPFIDIMLVLLIIFMATASVSTVAINVDLPSVSAKPALPPTKPVMVTVRADGSVLLDQTPVSAMALATTLVQKIPDKQTRIYLSADKQVRYVRLMTVMNTLRSSGYIKIALVARQETGGS